MKSKLINIGEDFTEEGLKALRKGQLLRFQGKEGLREFRIVSLNRRQKVVLVKEIRTYSPDEVKIVDK